MERFFTLVSIFGENNPGLAFVISLVSLVMIWRMIVSLARLGKYPSQDEKKSAWVTTTMTVLFFVVAFVMLYSAPTLLFTTNGEGIIGTVAVLYALLVWRFSDDDVWVDGVIDLI